MNDGVDRERVFSFVNLSFDSIGIWWMDTTCFSNKSLGFYVLRKLRTSLASIFADQSLICHGTQVYFFFFLVNFGLVSFFLLLLVHTKHLLLSLPRGYSITSFSNMRYDRANEILCFGGLDCFHLSSIAIGGPGTICLNSDFSSQKPFYW